jgi:hypothetical protein
LFSRVRPSYGAMRFVFLLTLSTVEGGGENLLFFKEFLRTNKRILTQKSLEKVRATRQHTDAAETPFLIIIIIVIISNSARSIIIYSNNHFSLLL